jgi:hypothetical protein
MSEFKDKIPAASGKVEYLYDPASKQIASRISGFARALYIVAVSVDGKRLLSTVPAVGLGRSAVYPQPSVIAYVQSDEQGMWGRNCPLCQKYFRTNHVMDVTFCPYCSQPNEGLTFCTKDQRTYLIAVYDTFARAYLSKSSTALNLAEVTDRNSAWHYSEEKQQFHFTCQTADCGTETDILGEYGYCPRCGRTNARKLFPEFVDKEVARLEEVRQTVSERRKREEVWEKMTLDALSKFEALAKHLRRRLLSFPMTARRRVQVEKLNFQKPLLADESMKQWFDIGAFEWVGNGGSPARQVAASEIPFIKKMVQRRHILIHNGGLVDQEYLDLSGDTQARLDERITIRSNEAKRFLALVGGMGMNLLDNIEEGFII